MATLILGATARTGVVHAHRDFIDWVVTVFTIVGVMIALYQSFRSGSLARAAHDAIVRSESRIAANHLIGVSATMACHEQDLAVAAHADDRERTRVCVGRLRDFAAELEGAVARSANTDADVLTHLKNVSSSGVLAQLAIDEGKGKMITATKQLRVAVSEAAVSLNRYAGRLKSSSGDQ